MEGSFAPIPVGLADVIHRQQARWPILFCETYFSRHIDALPSEQCKVFDDLLVPSVFILSEFRVTLTAATQGPVTGIVATQRRRSNAPFPCTIIEYTPSFG